MRVSDRCCVKLLANCEGARPDLVAGLFDPEDFEKRMPPIEPVGEENPPRIVRRTGLERLCVIDHAVESRRLSKLRAQEPTCIIGPPQSSFCVHEVPNVSILRRIKFAFGL